MVRVFPSIRIFCSKQSNVCKHEGSGKQFNIGGQVRERIFEGAEE